MNKEPDIVKRLRNRIPQMSSLDRDRETMEMALNEIERLRQALRSNLGVPAESIIQKSR